MNTQPRQASYPAGKWMRLDNVPLNNGRAVIEVTTAESQVAFIGYDPIMVDGLASVTGYAFRPDGDEEFILAMVVHESLARCSQ
jgi:hypothetical protein